MVNKDHVRALVSEHTDLVHEVNGDGLSAYEMSKKNERIRQIEVEMEDYGYRVDDFGFYNLSF